MGFKKKCSHCGLSHPDSYHTEKRISDKGYPTHDPHYKTAHEEATKKEKARFPSKNFAELKKMDRSIAKHELIGKNSKTGKITVSEKVPKKLRPEVAFHEKEESKNLKRLKK